MGKKKRNNPYNLDTHYNSYWKIYHNLKELYITSFRWGGLPTTVNERYLELQLFETGQIVFFEDENIGFLALQSVNQGRLDVYREPKQTRAFAENGYQKLLTNHKDGVIIYNNYIRDTPHHRILDYAKRIYQLERTIDVNIQSQKTPKVIQSTKKQELTLKSYFKQYDEYEPVIIVDDGLDVSKLNAIDTSSPYVADKLFELKKKLWNEALSYIGIENNSSEKKERLTDEEVLISNGLAIANRNSRLQARERGVEEINKLFNLDVSVQVSNLSLLDVETDTIGGEEVE